MPPLRPLRPIAAAEAPAGAEAEALDVMVAAVLAGRPRAVEALVGALHPRVFRWALAWVDDADEAEDIVQAAFNEMLVRLAGYRGPSALPAWMYRITQRIAVRQQRRRRRALRPVEAVQRLGGAPEYGGRSVYETDPGARVDRERLLDAVRIAWRRLPPRRQAVLDLVDLQGLAPAEAAQLLGLKPVTLRANLFKARRALRTRLATLDATGRSEHEPEAAGGTDDV